MGKLLTSELLNICGRHQCDSFSVTFNFLPYDVMSWRYYVNDPQSHHLHDRQKGWSWDLHVPLTDTHLSGGVEEGWQGSGYCESHWQEYMLSQLECVIKWTWRGGSTVDYWLAWHQFDRNLFHRQLLHDVTIQNDMIFPSSSCSKLIELNQTSLAFVELKEKLRRLFCSTHSLLTNPPQIPCSGLFHSEFRRFKCLRFNSNTDKSACQW